MYMYTVGLKPLSKYKWINNKYKYNTYIVKGLSCNLFNETVQQLKKTLNFSIPFGQAALHILLVRGSYLLVLLEVYDSWRMTWLSLCSFHK